MRFRLFLTLIVGLGLAGPSAADAATITVNSKLDSGGACTLRRAITSANTNAASGQCPKGDPSPTVDTINFAVTPGAPPITLTTSLPTITSSLRIAGPGAGQLTVSGGDTVRVLQINSGTVTISGLTIAHGFCDSTCDDGAVGAGILNNDALTLNGVTVSDNEANDDNDPSFPEGGGIFNQDTVTIVNSTVRGNTATASGATTSNGPYGGGIFNNDTMTLDRSTVTDNTASATGGTSTNSNGGGIDNFGTLTVRRSTLSGNTATGTGGSTSNNAAGGAIAAANAPTVKINIDRSTLSGNEATATGGNGVAGGLEATALPTHPVAITRSTITANSAEIDANLSPGTAATLKSTIVSNPQGGGNNCGLGGVASQGYNLEDQDDCGFDESTDQPNTNPLLGGLTNNGGPTETHAPSATSPAIDKGASSCTTDQRGLPSPSNSLAIPNAPGGNGADIGAVERQLDTTAPGTSITSGPAAGSLINDRTPTFGLGATEICSTFQCKIDSGAFSACKSPHTTASLGDGKHTLSVRAVDAAHHPDPSPATRTLSIDATGPETTIDKAPKKKVKTRKKRKKAKFRFSSPESQSSFECSLDDGAFEPCASPFKTKVKKGKHSFEVQAIDALGNAGAPDSHKWKVKRKRR